MTMQLPTYKQVEEFAKDLGSALHNTSTDELMSTARLILFAQHNLGETLEKVEAELNQRASYVQGCLNQIAGVIRPELHREHLSMLQAIGE